MEYALSCTKHAVKRMAVRSISDEDVDLALGCGVNMHFRNAEHFILRRKDLAGYGIPRDEWRRLDGLHVICNSWGEIVTVYREYKSQKVF